MSRALDKNVKKALVQGDHGRVFGEIATVLSSQTTGSLLEIELLGHSHDLDPDACLLRDGNAVAIPKLRLVQAFIHARHIFNTRKSPGLSGGAINEATAVMLLFDPEHLSAANARKTILSDVLSRPDEAAAQLMREKTLIDSLLTSRLHRHTKSPNLWSHRRWLMERCREAGLAVDAAEDIRTVVFVSAERHPRNYYAWCHARQLVKPLVGDGTTRTDATMSMILGDSMRWCHAHHDDVSGWMFLLSLLDICPDGVSSVLAETLKLAELFRWRNESVWYFLRNLMLSARMTEAQREQFRAVWQAVGEDVQEDSRERRVLDGVPRWMEKYTTRVPQPDGEGPTEEFQAMRE